MSKTQSNEEIIDQYWSRQISFTHSYFDEIKKFMQGFSTLKSLDLALENIETCIDNCIDVCVERKAIGNDVDEFTDVISKIKEYRDRASVELVRSGFAKLLYSLVIHLNKDKATSSTNNLGVGLIRIDKVFSSLLSRYNKSIVRRAIMFKHI